MAFATRRFALYESWGLTRGHVLKIFGVVFVLAVVIWLFEIATLRVRENGTSCSICFPARARLRPCRDR